MTGAKLEGVEELGSVSSSEAPVRDSRFTLEILRFPLFWPTLNSVCIPPKASRNNILMFEATFHQRNLQFFVTMNSEFPWWSMPPEQILHRFGGTIRRVPQCYIDLYHYICKLDFQSELRFFNRENCLQSIG